MFPNSIDRFGRHKKKQKKQKKTKKKQKKPKQHNKNQTQENQEKKMGEMEIILPTMKHYPKNELEGDLEFSTR